MARTFKEYVPTPKVVGRFTLQFATPLTTGMALALFVATKPGVVMFPFQNPAVLPPAVVRWR